MEVGMTRAAQKREEIFFADEFLRDQLTLKIAELKPAIQEPPDCSAMALNTDGTITLLDLEVAEYYGDDRENGGSPVKRLSSYWDKVYTVLSSQLETLRLPVYVSVRFKEPVSLKNGQITSFANELISFAREFCPKEHRECTTHEVFSSDSYPLLNEHVKRIDLTYLNDTVVIGWHCSNIGSAFVGVNRAHIADVVRRKSAKNFNWVQGAEKCLLIYASGGTVTSRAGPLPPDPSVWNEKELIASCMESVFDRIYFWERVRKWHKRLK